MSLAEIQKLTARLYTDSKLRREFLSEPEKIGREFNLTQTEIFELAQVLPEELNFFAESLFYKRLREVEKLLPRTKHALSSDFEKYFREFSHSFLPASIKKHLEDAVEFSDFLTKQKLDPEWIRDLIRYEQAKLIFNGYRSRFLFRLLEFNVARLSQNETSPKRRLTFIVWFRFGEKSRHFVW